MLTIQYQVYIKTIEHCLELLTDLIQNWHEVEHHNAFERMHTDHCSFSTHIGICGNTNLCDVPAAIRELITMKWVKLHGNPEIFYDRDDMMHWPVGGPAEYNTAGWDIAKNKYKNMNRLSYAIYVRTQLVTELIKLRNDQAYLDELCAMPKLLFLEKYGV